MAMDTVTYLEPRVAHFLDDRDADARRLIEGRNGDKMLAGGTILLQSESHPIESREVEILPLSPRSPVRGHRVTDRHHLGLGAGVDRVAGRQAGDRLDM